jgi:hypothetical protein
MYAQWLYRNHDFPMRGWFPAAAAVNSSLWDPKDFLMEIWLTVVTIACPSLASYQEFLGYLSAETAATITCNSLHIYQEFLGYSLHSCQELLGDSL